MKNQTCCFTGHREIVENEYKLIIRKTNEEIEQLIMNDINIFITGGALGFDTVCALLILNLKEVHPQIKLHLALPCKTQTKNWTTADTATYEKIFRLADKVTYVLEIYFRGCMHKRNRYMVDNSSYCIAYCTKKNGGTFYTINYALRQRNNLINIVDFI